MHFGRARQIRLACALVAAVALLASACLRETRIDIGTPERVADGVSLYRLADPNLLDLAQLYHARRWQVVMLMRVPGALPALITGLRLAAVYAPIGALIGEWVGASSGLGYAMLLANARAQTDVMFAALILLIAMSVALRGLVDLATAKLTPWAAESQ